MVIEWVTFPGCVKEDSRQAAECVAPGCTPPQRLALKILYNTVTLRIETEQRFTTARMPAARFGRLRTGAARAAFHTSRHNYENYITCAS